MASLADQYGGGFKRETPGKQTETSPGQLALQVLERMKAEQGNGQGGADPRTGTPFDPNAAINPQPQTPQVPQTPQPTPAPTTVPTDDGGGGGGGGGIGLPSAESIRHTAGFVGGAVTGGIPGILAAAVGNEITDGLLSHTPFSGDIKGKTANLEPALIGIAQRKGIDALTRAGEIFDLQESSDYQNLMMQYNTAAQLFLDQKDVEGFKAYAQQFTAQLPSLLGQIKTVEDQKLAAQKEEQERLNTIMSMQHAFAPIFESIIGSSQDSNSIAYQMQVQAANALKSENPTLAALITSTAANQRSSADALLAAYANQVRLAPASVLDVMSQSTAAQYNPFQQPLQ